MKSPSVRAKEVYELLKEISGKRYYEEGDVNEEGFVENSSAFNIPELSTWDIICFTAEFLALQSITDMPFLHDTAKRLVNDVYTAHYLRHENEIHDKRKL